MSHFLIRNLVGNLAGAELWRCPVAHKKQSSRLSATTSKQAPKSRLGNLAMLAILGLAVLGFGLARLTAHSSSEHRTHHHDESSTQDEIHDQAEDVVADAARARTLRDRMLVTIAPLAARDPEIAMLRDFFQRQAIPAAGLTGHLYIPPAADLITDEMVTEQMFFFVATDYEHLQQLGFQVVSPYEFTEDRQLRFTSGVTTEQLEISGFLHELRHAYDRCTGLEPPSQIFTDPWTEGEVRAYRLQIRVLDLLTDGRFTALAEGFATRAVVPSGRVSIPTVTQREATELEELMGPYVGNIDLQFRTGALLISANFIRNARLGLTHADDLDTFREIQRESLRMFDINR